jgi:hypothetical protein
MPGGVPPRAGAGPATCPVLPASHGVLRKPGPSRWGRSPTPGRGNFFVSYEVTESLAEFLPGILAAGGVFLCVRIPEWQAREPAGGPWFSWS